MLRLFFKIKKTHVVQSQVADLRQGNVLSLIRRNVTGPKPFIYLRYLDKIKVPSFDNFINVLIVNIKRHIYKKERKKVKLRIDDIIWELSQKCVWRSIL